ncbi:ArsR/SmtB family transcription factor [Streptomyces flaveus]|uniref:ArsR/SmtB family transcription factor n=1 Tax=Streptomyces flaveus TaxID=66370 RepID=UPI0033345E2E
MHLTGEDLCRTCIADGPALMWEITLSRHWLQRNSGGLLGEGWRGSVVRNLPRSAELLVDLIPPRGYFPDFLTPHGPFTEVTAALDPVLSVPKTRLRQDLERLAQNRRPSFWIRELTEGGRGALTRLGNSFHAYHQVAVAPFWKRIQRHVAHEHVRASALMAEGGTEALLSRLSPTMRWRYPILEVDYPVDRELRPGGRGLVLIPSFFCRDRPITLVWHDQTPVLVYPLEHRPLDFVGTVDYGKALDDLLGNSRATVLEAISGDCNTSELARRAGVLTSSASQHLAVLRRAGLVASRRQGNSVVHTVTPLGTSLLRVSQP